jgi:hypothetical protein
VYVPPPALLVSSEAEPDEQAVRPARAIAVTPTAARVRVVVRRITVFLLES